jgi:hypothetical protein
MPTTRRSRRIRIGLAGAAAMVLAAASAGGAMGWVMGGTTEAISAYKTKAVTAVPEKAVIEPVEPAAATVAVVTEPASRTAAWFPANNTVQWATSAAPGQALSGVSVRNGDQDMNLIAHLSARAANGGWIPVASMTISPGRESILRPPAGDYAMQLVASPIDMPYDRIAALPKSPPTSFALAPQNPSAIPSVRFDVSEGVVKRLPDPNATGARTTRATIARRNRPVTTQETVPAPARTRSETVAAETVDAADASALDGTASDG